MTDKRVPRLRLLAAAQTREKDDVDTTAFRDLVTSLRDRFDYVLVDCPAGIEKGFINAIAGADEAIIVCTPEVSAVRDADRVVGLLGEGRSVRLIVNRLRPALVRKGKMLSVDDVNGILHLPLLGVVTDAPDVIISTNRGEPVALDAGSPVGSRVPRDRAAARRNAHLGARGPARTIVLRETVRRPPRVIEFIQRLFGKPASSATAKERLRLVLLSDHISLAPDVVEALKHDLIDVISRYVEVDAEHVDVTFEQRETQVAMLANIPVLAMRSRPAPRPPGSAGRAARASGAGTRRPRRSPRPSMRLPRRRRSRPRRRSSGSRPRRRRRKATTQGSPAPAT